MPNVIGKPEALSGDTELLLQFPSKPDGLDSRRKQHVANTRRELRQAVRMRGEEVLFPTSKRRNRELRCGLAQPGGIRLACDVVETADTGLGSSP